ncbi:MAG: hypothetical protein MJ249_05460 [Kiritimatiellae bacterium]|nr:hypothetical protein [Kiritimatiellia bacterium]
MKNTLILAFVFGVAFAFAGCHHGHHHHHHSGGPGFYQQGPHGGYAPVVHPAPAHHAKPVHPPVVRPVPPPPPPARPR